jgi:hypothetical protein
MDFIPEGSLLSSIMRGPQADITFTVEDCLPEDSLLRPLMRGLWGEITMKFDQDREEYYSDHPTDFQTYPDVFDYDSIVSSSLELMFIPSYNDNIDLTASKTEACSTMFKGCLLRLEKIYKNNNILDDEVRNYPIYQLLESYYISTCLNFSHNPCSWRGFTLDPDSSIGYEHGGYISITRGEIKIYEIYVLSILDALKKIRVLMEDMKAGTADPILYSESPIERMKSARKTE